jgi:hypothetical protein
MLLEPSAQRRRDDAGASAAPNSAQHVNVEGTMKAIHAVVFVGSIVFLSRAGYAENGTVDVLISTVSVVTSVPMGDTTVTARSGTGTLTFIRSSGAPFVDGASGTAQFASFSKKTPSGFELEADGLATFSSADSLLLLFKRRSGNLAAGTSGEGTLQLSGGTGRYAGINGQCKYKVENLSSNWQVTIAKCQWSN